MRTLYRKFIFATIGILLISTICAFVLANGIYMTVTKQKIDQQNVEIAQEIASILERIHHQPSAVAPFLESVGNLGYQLYILDESGNSTYFGEPFNQKDIPRDAIKVIENHEVYHGMSETPQWLFMMWHFSNDVSNTVGVPFTFNDKTYGLFLRPNNKLLFSDIHMILASFFLVTAIVSLIGVILFTKRLIKPITRLTEATQEITRENFNYPLPAANNDEIGQLVKSFNKMQQQLQHNDEVRKSFINNVSHDFQSPLMNIQGYAELLKTNELTDDERTSYLQIIDDEAKRLSQLTRQLLLLTSLDKKGYPMKLSEVNIDQQIKQTIRKFQWRLNDKDIEISYNMDPIILKVDPELMLNVWENLLRNAIKYNVHGGSIWIGVFKKESTIEIQFKDTGIGLSSESIDQIFDRFFRVDAARKKDGTGLGLSIVKQIIDLHKGEITVDSEVGKGSTFTITLPMR